jgi:hypothetical protein
MTIQRLVRGQAGDQRFPPQFRSSALSASGAGMRSLWPIEREVLEITAAEYPASTRALRQQIDTVQVVEFENSGAGFFSNLAVAPDVPLLSESSPLKGAHGIVDGIEHGMGFIVFLKDGQLSMIEGYCNDVGPTTDIDFSRVVFALTPWGQQATAKL